MNASVREIVDAFTERPLANATTPPSSWYTDPRILDLENRTVFSQSWQMIGRADQAREPGNYFCAAFADERVIVVRGTDNLLRGFFNVCRHHAAAVLTEPCGKVSHLRCPYHGWTYDLAGNLVLTPEFAEVANFDRAANGLKQIEIADWNGWIFVKLEAAGISLPEFLGRNLLEQFVALALERFHWFERRTYTLNCNWKVFVDNYLDGGYHVPHLHGGLNSVLDYTNYTIQTGERFCLQSSPITANKGDPQTAALRTGERASYYWIYPNFMINIYGNAMDTNLVIPRRVDRTDVVFDYYFTDVSSKATEKNRASIAVSEQIQNEDVSICESVQRGLQSRAYSTGRLSVRREAGEHLFHKLLHADLRRGIKS
jgi:choline monooxygenase